MSSVVISGDTSGAITLAAPTVAGTNTATMPTTTGTVAVITSGSTLTFPDGSSQTGGPNLINNTGSSSDITLNVGQSAYVTFTSSTSFPLHVATATNQIYEINVVSTGTSASNLATLIPNNSSSWAYNTFQTYATSSPSVGNANFNFITTDTALRLSIGGTLLFANANIFTTTTNKAILVQGRDTSATIGYGYTAQSSTTDTTTVWTSLGTIASATALTGTVWIRRLA